MGKRKTARQIKDKAPEVTERFKVRSVEDDRFVYLGPGTSEKDAHRLSEALLHESEVVPVGVE